MDHAQGPRIRVKRNPERLILAENLIQNAPPVLRSLLGVNVSRAAHDTREYMMSGKYHVLNTNYIRSVEPGL